MIYCPFGVEQKEQIRERQFWRDQYGCGKVSKWTKRKTHENWKLPEQIPFSSFEGETPKEGDVFRLD